MCQADLGVAIRIASGLGSAASVLRMALAAQGGWAKVALEPLREACARRDQLSGEVILEVTTHHGIPHIFSLPPESALMLSDRLRSEALAARPIGSA